MKNILIISGLDPSGNAGLIVDIETAQNLAAHPCAIVATSTIQNAHAVSAAYAMKDDIFLKQLQSVIGKHPIHAVKIGLLVSRKTASILSSFFKGTKIPIVYDPVYQSSTGFYFCTKDEYVSIAAELSNITTLITPNRLEAEVLFGLKGGDQQIDIKSTGHFCNVLIKGGHFEKRMDDFLYSNGKGMWICGSNTQFRKDRHGTGCRLSTAIACFLAEGQNLEESIRSAKKYLEKGVAHLFMKKYIHF